MLLSKLVKTLVLSTFLISFSALTYENQDVNIGIINSDKHEKYKNFDEVRGIIVDRTITRLGEDFYRLFSQAINREYDPLKVNLTVIEKPTAMSGSIISIIHRNTVIFRTAITPGRAKTEKEVERATSITARHISKWEVERLFKDTFDLAHDEF